MPPVPRRVSPVAVQQTAPQHNTTHRNRVLRPCTAPSRPHPLGDARRRPERAVGRTARREGLARSDAVFYRRAVARKCQIPASPNLKRGFCASIPRETAETTCFACVFVPNSSATRGDAVVSGVAEATVERDLVRGAPAGRARGARKWPSPRQVSSICAQKYAVTLAAPFPHPAVPSMPPERRGCARRPPHRWFGTRSGGLCCRLSGDAPRRHTGVSRTTWAGLLPRVRFRLF